MKYLLIPDTGETRRLPFYFAMEEYVAQQITDDYYCCIWQVGPTVMPGRNQNIDNGIDTGYCKRNGIDIFRRKSGCCLQFSYIVHEKTPRHAFEEHMQTIVALLPRDGHCGKPFGQNFYRN